jgi:pantoate--beta-alanine ligase
MSNLMMIVTTLEELCSARAILDKPVGFVPTMGYLHEGHLSLAHKARKECAGVIASIFVNPTQFGPNEDLSKYPRDLDRDLHFLEEAGVDLVWTPTPEIMYPAGFQTWVTVEELTQPLEGAMRPGHFRGVTTIVTKLFNSVQPQKAYFGQKDAQQAAVIRRMTMDLNLPIEIIICPTIREPDGLAMSSRNIYLKPDERQAATVLYRALNAAKASYEQGEQNAGSLKQIMTGIISSEPLAKLQYVSCTDFDTLKELEGVSGKTLISMAVYFGKTRLIDNFVLG